MATESLSASIFGEAQVDVDGGLSNLFSAASSSTLPAKPNNVNFLEAPSERTKREKKEEKRKKRKRKDAGDDNEPATANVSSADKKIKSDEKEGEVKQENDITVATDKNNGEGDGDDNKKTATVPSRDEEECTVFVGNLPLDTNRKSLESMFKECGKIKSSRLRSYATEGVKVAPEQKGNQV